MQKLVWKLPITAFVLTLSIVAGARTSQANSSETFPCEDGMYQCMCTSHVWFCVYSWRECEELRYQFNCW
jgi:hypothetical protein